MVTRSKKDRRLEFVLLSGTEAPGGEPLRLGYKRRGNPFYPGLRAGFVNIEHSRLIQKRSAYGTTSPKRPPGAMPSLMAARYQGMPQHRIRLKLVTYANRIAKLRRLAIQPTESWEPQRASPLPHQISSKGL